jgi:DegV family protein with EDD domain
MLSQSKALPTTSQPTPDDFLPYFERARDQGDHLICALLSSQLSGTVQSAQIAREMCGYEHIYIIDSTLAIVALRAMLDLGEQLRSQGMSAPDIAAQIEAAKSRMRVFGIVDTLEYLHKGGRMSTSVAVVGSLLRVKPIITLKDGVLGLVGKGVGTKGSLAGMLKQVGDDIHPDPRLPIYYGYSGDDTLCRQFVPLMEEKFGPHGQEIRSIGCVIGTHLGPNAAVVAYLEQDK